MDLVFFLNPLTYHVLRQHGFKQTVSQNVTLTFYPCCEIEGTALHQHLLPKIIYVFDFFDSLGHQLSRCFFVGVYVCKS